MPEIDIRLLLTRPQPQSATDLQILRQAGYQVWAAPLLSFTGCCPWQGVALSEYLSRFDAIIALSPRASQFCQPSRWPQRDYYAMGSASARLWQQQGLNVQLPANANSEGMLALLSNNPQLAEQHCLILRGQIGRDWLAAPLHERAKSVTELCCYRQIPQQLPKSVICDWQARQINFIVCNSEQQALQLYQLCRTHQALDWLAQCSLLVPSERVAKRLHHLNCLQIYDCQGADITAVQTTLTRIQRMHHD